MSRLKSRLRTIFVIACLLLFAGLLLPVKSFAADLSNVAPNPDNSGPTPPGGQHVFLIRSNFDKGTNPIVELKAYYPTSMSDTAWAGQYLQIDPYKIDSSTWGPCQTYNTVGVTNKNDYIDVNITADGEKPRAYHISIDNVCNFNANHVNLPGGANNQLYGEYPLWDTPPKADIETGSQYRTVTMVVSYNHVGKPNTSVGNNKATFQVEARNSNDNLSPSVLIGQVGGDDKGNQDSQYDFPIVGQDQYNGHTNIKIPFGMNCVQDQNAQGKNLTNQIVGIYDADNGPAGGFAETLEFRVVDTTDSSSIPFTIINDDAGNTSGYTDTIGGAHVFPDKLFVPEAGNKGKAGVSISMQPYHRYELDVFGLDAANTIVVNLPTDSLFGSVGCPSTANLAPHAQLTTNGKTYTQGNNPQVLAGSTVSLYNWVSTNGTGNTNNTRFQYSVNGTQNAASWATGNVGSTSYPYEPDGDKPSGQNKLNFTIPPGTPAGTKFCRETDIDPTSLESWVTYPSLSAQVCFTVTATPPVPQQQPYLSVLGGDIAAGPGFSSGGSCDTSSSDASIIGNFNSPGGADGPYGGASAQLAALALRDINGFATGRYQQGGSWLDALGGAAAAGTEQELSYANTSNVGAGNYGGDFDDPSWCVDDYYQDAGSGSGVGSTVDVSALGVAHQDKTYTYSGSLLTLSGNTIPADGRHVTLVVTGDVYIKPGAGPYPYVQYGDAGNNLDNLPSFRLIVEGRILVDPAITTLDGFYDAQGDKGAFITCANSGGAISLASSASTCSTPLTVRGAVAANYVVANRTYGDANNLRGVPQAPAETFLFSPQVWLPKANGSGGMGPWDSVTSLPPIL